MSQHWIVIIDKEKWSGKIHSDFKLARKEAIALSKKKQNQDKKIFVTNVFEVYRRNRKKLYEVKLETFQKSFFD